MGPSHHVTASAQASGHSNGQKPEDPGPAQNIPSSPSAVRHAGADPVTATSIPRRCRLLPLPSGCAVQMHSVEVGDVVHHYRKET